MDAFKVRSDGREELLASGLNCADLEELRDWFRYTKPLDDSLRIVVRDELGGVACFSAVTAGHVVGRAEMNSAEGQLTH